MKRFPIIAGAAAVVVLIVAGASLFTVSQTEQVLLTQFGQPIRVIKDPGLHVKLPFVQTVIPFDNRLLDFSSGGEEVILADQRRLTIDSFTRYRITNPTPIFPGDRAERGRHPRPVELGRDLRTAPGARQRDPPQRSLGRSQPHHGADQGGR